jgi:hypothetical protein
MLFQRFVLLVVGFLTTCAVASCSHDDADPNGPLSGVDQGSNFEVTSDGIQVGQTASVGGILLCTNDGQTATLDRLEAEGVAGQVVVEPAGVQPTPVLQQTGAGIGPLPAERYRPVFGTEVTTKCGTEPGPELAVQLRRTGPGNAGVKGFSLYYKVDGKLYVMRVPISVILCDPAVTAGSEPFSDSCRRRQDP